MDRLSGKVAVITGASRGIGAAAARRFCEEGARVVISHHPSGPMTDLAQQLAADLRAGGHEAIATPTDVADGADVRRLVATTEEAFGPADIMVTNAAAFTSGPWDSVTEEEWDHVFAVNAKGTHLCAAAVLPSMIDRGAGSIITVSSVMAHAGMTGMLPYTATKGAVIAYTRALAREVGRHGIRVNSVMPGAIRTEHEIEKGDGDDADRMAAEQQSIPVRLFAEDLAGTFVYLASDDSRLVTGQVVAVDGGLVNR